MALNEVIIEPSRRIFFLDWKELIRYRDLLFFLVRQELSTKFRQSLLGPLWFLIQPLLTTFVYVIIFAKVARIPSDGIPHSLFYLFGISLWSYFSLCAINVADSLTEHADLMGKVHFPRLLVPLSILLWRLAPLGLQLFCFLLYFGYERGTLPPFAAFLTIPLLTLQLALLSFGVGLFVSSATVTYRDLAHLFGHLFQLWLFATPIIYPFSSVPEALKIYFEWNPLTAIFEFGRHRVFGIPFELGHAFLRSWLITLLAVSLGFWLFQRVERTFTDTV